MSAILVLTLTFFVVSRVILLLIASEITLRHFESKPQITFFLKDDTKSDQVKKITGELKNDSKVSQVKYVSKDEALKIYRKQFEKDPLLLEMVTSSILPASIEVSTYKVDDLQMIFDVYKNHPAIEEITFQKDIVNNLSRWAKAARLIGLEHIGSHMLLSLLVIMLFISAKIANKKEEIEVLRLLGASDSYVRIPFILEGMFYGLVSSFMAAVIFIIVMVSGRDPLSFIFTELHINFIDVTVYALYFSATVVLGLILGWLSSLLAVFRFLR